MVRLTLSLVDKSDKFFKVSSNYDVQSQCAKTWNGSHGVAPHCSDPRLAADQGKKHSEQLAGDYFVPSGIKVNGVSLEVDRIRFSAHIAADIDEWNVVFPAQFIFHLKDLAAGRVGGYEFVFRG